MLRRSAAFALYFLVALGAGAFGQYAQQAVNAIVATTCSASQWVRVIAASGAATCSQPASTDVSGLGTMATQNANAVAITGGTIAGLTGLAVRDTSAAFDVTFAGVSSTALTAGRTLTYDLVNGARTFKLGSNLTIASDPGAVSGAVKSNGSGTFAQAASTDLSDTASIVTSSSTNTFTNKTFSPTATGNKLVGSPVLPQGRLTLTSNAPVLTSSVTGATTLYYTSYMGKLVPIYDGTNLYPLALCAANTAGACEISIALGSNWAANAAFDTFVYNSSGTATLCTVAWTNTTTRATALQLFDGIQTNGASATCRTNNTTTFTLSVNQGTYLGSFYTNGSTGQIDYIFGASASGGTAASFGICNYYNRVGTATVVTDSVASYTYSSATIRQAGGSAGNQVKYMNCLQEDGAVASISTRTSTSAALSAQTRVGIGLDSTSAFVNQDAFQCYDIVAAVQNTCIGTVGDTLYPAIGVHTISKNEQSDGTNSNTFNGGSIDRLSVMVLN